MTEQQPNSSAPQTPVPSYQEVAFDGAWKARSRGMWAVSALGLAAGATIGLIAPIFPVLIGAQTAAAAVALIPQSLAIFSAVGMGTGFTAGMAVGSSSGAIASVAKEQERRLREAGIALPDDAAQQAQQQEADAKKPFLERVKDKINTYFNPKVGALFTTLGVVGGLVMAAAFIASGGLAGGAAAAAVPALSTMLGAAATSAPAVTAYFAGVMGCFGALFAFNFPKMAGDLTSFTGDLLSGKKLGTQWGPKPEAAPVQQAAIEAPAAEPAQEAAAPTVTQQKHSDRSKLQPSQSYQDMLAQKATAQTEGPSLKA